MASWPRPHYKQQFLSTWIHLLAVNVLSDSFSRVCTLKSVRAGAGQVSQQRLRVRALVMHRWIFNLRTEKRAAAADRDRASKLCTFSCSHFCSISLTLFYLFSLFDWHEQEINFRHFACASNFRCILWRAARALTNCIWWLHSTWHCTQPHRSHLHTHTYLKNCQSSQKLSHKSRAVSLSLSLPSSLYLSVLPEELLMSISLLLFPSLNSQNADVRVASAFPWPLPPAHL